MNLCQIIIAYVITANKAAAQILIYILKWSNCVKLRQNGIYLLVNLREVKIRVRPMVLRRKIPKIAPEIRKS